MYFKRLEMQGFKSFVEPVVIDFHEGVTCIVGPNGSGKSNISDAIRWVLGEQSPKAIRGSKMEDIIFSGTVQRKARGMAEVTLVIDNELGLLPIEYNEVAITRRLYRSGESEYLINNNPCRLRDIKELIMDTGIGVDGYSVISQGKITELIESKPESRREIFEEAAGVMMYKTKKAEAERKLASTQINLDRVQDIVSEIEGRIDSLKEESKKAKEFIVLRDRRKELEINITLRNVEKFSESNETGTNDVKEIEENITKLKNEKIDVDNSLIDLKNRFEDLDRLANQKRDSLITLTNELNEITSNSLVNEEKVNSIIRDIERLNSEITLIKEKLEEELKHAKIEEDKKASNDDNVRNANKRLEEEIGIYNSLVKDQLDLEEKIEELKNQLISNNNLLVIKNSEVKNYERYKETLAKQKEKILEETKEILENNKNVDKEIVTVNQELEDNNSKLLESKKVYEKTIKVQNENISVLKELRFTLEDLKIRKTNISSRMKTIQEMESNYEGYNGAVRFVMKENFKGIHGVVASIISVPTGYETAIETALGQALSFVICDKDNDAKLVINELKEKSQGRLTFLPIGSISGKEISINPIIKNGRGFIGLASSLIKYDSKYSEIIKYLLGKTIIVKDLDSAINLSKVEKSGLKFVTLDGEVISQSGSITGGRYKNQSANLLSRRNEIDKLKDDLLKIENDINDVSKNITVKEKLDEEINLKVYALIENEKNLQIEHTSILSRLKNLENIKNDSNDQSLNKDLEIKNIENDILNATNMVINLNKECDLISNDVLNIDNNINILLNDLDLYKEKVLNQNDKVTEARINKNSVDLEIDKIDSILNVILDNIDGYTEQINSKNDELEELENKKNTLLFGSGDKANDITSLVKEKEELESYIKEVDRKKTELSTEINTYGSRQNSLIDSINDLIDKKQQYEIKLAKNEANLETAKQKLWDDFEISYAEAMSYRKDDFVYSTAVKESKEIRDRLFEIGDVNIGSIEEYDEVSTRYEFLTTQRDDILKAKEELLRIIKDMDKTIRVKFKDNFDKVCSNFEITFKELFGGGEAHLSLVDETNPLESGVDINVQPPGKKIQNIDAFSGGEKTMIGLALMMAVLRTKPTPFCILDEVEAALDEANIDKFANSLRDFNATQFTVITHQKATMEHADVLYGVTMPEQGISKVLSLRLGDKFEI